jgi:hypothetical protein
VSRVIPGKKDYISIKVIDVKIHEQKWLLLCNLKELSSHFKNSHSGVKVGFLKLASLHPRNCIMAGASGTHSVCVCMYNSPKCEVNVWSLQNIRTNKKQWASPFFRDCSESPEPTDLENTLEDVFTDNAIEKITFKLWISTDRWELVTTVKSTEEFIVSLLEKLLLLLHHSFIYWNTASYVPQRTEM